MPRKPSPQTDRRSVKSHEAAPKTPIEAPTPRSPATDHFVGSIDLLDDDMLPATHVDPPDCRSETVFLTVAWTESSSYSGGLMLIGASPNSI
jgi:hypothetical protein